MPTPTPGPGALVDALAVLVLTATALGAFWGTFEGLAWVLGAGVALVAGVLLALALDRLRLPWWALPPALVTVTALLAPALTQRGTDAGPWPTPAAWAALADTATDGWRRLLTTLPPVDGSGPLSLLPFLLALAGASTGMLLALRGAGAYRPLLGPAVVAVLAAALGVSDPGGIAARGALLLGGGVVWGTLRARRRVVLHTGPSRERLATATLLLALTGMVVLGAFPWVGAGEREVLREHVQVPFSVTDRPSPLAAFRAFRPAVGDLADRELFTVAGLPEGTLVRLSTLDTYSGTVWAAGGSSATSDGVPGGFLRVGARIPRAGSGPTTQVRVTVAAGWADRPELGIWVPTLGDETRVAFAGAGAQDRDDALRYNLDTGAAVLPGGLEAGESYLLTEQLGASDTRAPATPQVDPDLLQPVARLVAASAGGGGDPMARVRAVATRLRTTGAYSDGGAGEEAILPGHSLGRLVAFVGDRQPAGDDEQYAATLALSAVYLGLPARVVLGAVPGADGVVRGSDVRAWVEVHDGSRWQLLAPEEFVPPRDREPSPRSVLEQDRTRAAAVPPPSAQRPPSSEDGFTLDETASGRARSVAPEVPRSWPLWVSVSLGVAAVPALGLPLWTAVVVLLKALRRSVRARRGSPAARAAAAWRDVVGTLHDAGYPVSTHDTRREVARAVGGAALLDTARAVDVALYGPAGASDPAAERAWELAARVRRELLEGRGWRERWRRAVSLRSLTPEPVLVPVRTPSGIHAGRMVPVASAR
ncbi:transglutaminase domain-containing protein [Phycicoccus endophyticus]|uniref:Transglutaminase domain-containing protein n=1 Tax=Phycicoccus endophyticus TaxID=1690220 RepID=A0A7G9QZF6_9MICO|nr:transglutaminase-like domain-containing protein [Phycicoccus endophyticus]NHI19091.1 transglutaminase domain-containing protein [Phycicoccus endophyticus]QNN48731.1 transglutaminase domain-containing protein [Phycicoccus endophyticus]